jgi:protoheme IX farnesyltransferase
VLFLAGLCPFLLKMNGAVYLAVAIVLGGAYFWCAVRFARQLTIARARQLFLASIIYLPLLLVAMVCDKLK